MRLSRCVVITGSIGCGKSSVCELLKSKGFAVIDADKISKDVTPTQLPKIAATFGEEYIKDGELDSRKLGKLVFSDKAAKTKLEEIMHPPIKQKIFEEAQKLEKDNKIYFIDIPLFFESKNYTELSPVAVVYAPKEAQIQRVLLRNNLDRQEVLSRIASQIDIQTKAARADFIIDNSGDKSKLVEEVDKFLDKVDKWFCKNTVQAETIF